MKAFILGTMASFFFAFTFLLNQQMNILGGSWLWASSLRYFFMLPILFIIMIMKHELNQVVEDIIVQPAKWLIWSTIGFGLFYAPLCFSSAFGESWLVAGTWQITIIAGTLIYPLFSKNPIPKRPLLLSSIILLGVFLMQSEVAKHTPSLNTFLGIIPVIIAAFAYPLGNRKMMEVCHNRFTTLQRVFGMTLCSMPFWILLAIFALFNIGPPSKGQIIKSFIVAIFSGIIATLLFFKATALVCGDPHKLAVVESTQAGEVIFTLLGGIFIFHHRSPSLISLIGVFVVFTGMVLNSISKDKASSNK